MSSSIKPQNNRDIIKVFSASGPNLMNLTWTADELSRGQAQNGVNFDLKLNLTLKIKVNHPPKQ